MSLAQIGEFAFVLLSRASNLHLVEVCNLLRFVMVLKPLLFFFFAHGSEPDNHFFVFLVFILANTCIILNLHNSIKLVM